MNMKSCVLSAFLLISSALGYGQSIDYGKIIPNDSAAAANIAEKLVQLAWANNPDNKQVIDASKSVQYELKLSRVTWLNSLVATGNLNEFTINPKPGVNNIFFPRYNFGLTLPLGIYPVNHLTTQVVKKRYDVSLDAINSQKLDIRNKVLDRYQDYILAKELLKLETITSEEASTQFLVMQKKFKDNKGTLQAYNEAQQKMTAESIVKLNAERNFSVAKNDLERLIGVNLDQLIKN